jgi:hypothetical protein
MAIEFSIRETLDDRALGIGEYQATRASNNPGEPRFLFCGHRHLSAKEARKCRDFSQEAE